MMTIIMGMSNNCATVIVAAMRAYIYDEAPASNNYWTSRPVLSRPCYNTIHADAIAIDYL